MRIILLQDVPTLGQRNDVKDVRDGYARNFLFPQGFAKPATETALKQAAELKALRELEKSEEYQKHQTITERLKTITLSFKVKIGEKGRAYGSVTAVKIRDALKKQGIAVEKDWIRLREPIRTVGEHQIVVQFPQGPTGKVTANIEAE